MAQRKQTKVVPKSGRVPNAAHLGEDDADYIISEKRLREEPGGVTIQQYLRKHGYTLERHPETKLRSRA
jgi:hypothetical protein